MALASGTRVGFIAGVMLGHLAFWLDHVDGQVARWQGSACLSGVYFDYLMHHVASLTLGFSLGYGLAARTGDLRWAAAGFLIAAGWVGLGLQNDCRYKAFFQRLKASTDSYGVDGGSGGRPAPPAPWPHRGIGMLSWPAAKACEPHVVLLALTVLAALALVWPPLWLTLWRGGMVAMVVLAPALAVGRAARAIRRGDVEEEFDRWFQPKNFSSPDPFFLDCQYQLGKDFNNPGCSYTPRS